MLTDEANESQGNLINGGVPRGCDRHQVIDARTFTISSKTHLQAVCFGLNLLTSDSMRTVFAFQKGGIIKSKIEALAKGEAYPDFLPARPRRPVTHSDISDNLSRYKSSALNLKPPNTLYISISLEAMGSVVLPHLQTGWHVDQAILSEEERLVIIRFGRDWDKDCMRQDEVLYRKPSSLNVICVLSAY